jgi:hypothetical protein
MLATNRLVGSLSILGEHIGDLSRSVRIARGPERGGSRGLSRRRGTRGSRSGWQAELQPAAHHRAIPILEWTPPDHLRHASFVALREDKNPRSVTRDGL